MEVDAEVPDVKSVQNITIEAYQTPLRIYAPESEGKHPLILFIHGGGWVGGNFETHDNLARYPCKNTNSVVLAVGYANAPEKQFPTQMEQCYEALLWAEKNSSLLNTDGRIAVCGDSAGGVMSAALCLMARDRDGPKICYQTLINPGPLKVGRPEDLSVIDWLLEMYAKDSRDLKNPYLLPSLATDLSNLPPALIILGEQDPLKEEGEDFAQSLTLAGVDIETFTQKGVGHLGGDGARASEVALESLDVCAKSIYDALNKKTGKP